MSKTLLKLPDLKKQNIVTSYAQIRPYREGGYKIEKEVIGGKNIFHNYGHGGSGVSLSYGSAVRVADLFGKENSSKGNQCAVLGSGIIGLLTALELSKRGQKVRIYTKKLPSYGQKNNKLMMTSQIAPGFWFPYDYLDKPQLGLDQLASTTMTFLKQSIKDKRYMALKECKTYDQVYDPKVIQRFNPILLSSSAQSLVDFGNGVSQAFNFFTTVKIDMQLWLKQLLTQVIRSKVEFVIREFTDLKDILSMNQKYIFNCTGYGAKYLFNDQKMKAYRGHIVEFNNPEPQTFNYIFGAKVGNDVVRIYCHQTRILLGLTKEETEKIQVEQQTVDRLLKNYQEYRAKWALPTAKL